MIVYQVISFDCMIEVIIERETEKFYIKPDGERVMKNTAWSNYYKTKGEAMVQQKELLTAYEVKTITEYMYKMDRIKKAKKELSLA